MFHSVGPYTHARARAIRTSPYDSRWAEIVDKSRREFVRAARGFWLIPEIFPLADREDIALLYCLCRQLDDAVDEAKSPAEAREALAAYRAELRGQKTARPLVAAFLNHAPRRGVPLECLSFVLDGMELDLGVVRFADDESLLRYSYRVSAAVGLMLAPLVGVEEPAARARIVDLGLALQLSNIVLGVEEDARIGRVYLPERRLAAAGLTAEDVLRAPRDRRLHPVLQGLAELADRYYRSAAQGASLVPLRYRHGMLLFAGVYGGLARRVASGRPAPRKGQLPFRDKLESLATLAATAFLPTTMGLIPPPPHDASLHRAVAGWPGASSYS